MRSSPQRAAAAPDTRAADEAALLGPNTSVSWKATAVEVARSGDMGYLYGTYQLSMKGPKGGPAVNDTGKIVEVWKKQADSKWKCVVDAYNSDLPLPAPPPAPKRGKRNR